MNFNSLIRKCRYHKLLRHYRSEGFLVLEGFFEPSDLDVFLDETDQIIRNWVCRPSKITIDMLEGPDIGRRFLLNEVDNDSLKLVYKINDLFLESKFCEALSLSLRFRAIARMRYHWLGQYPLYFASPSREACTLR